MADVDTCLQKIVEQGATIAKLREENQRLHSLLRKLLDAGDWYISALEFDLSVDGEDLEKEIRKQLEGEK